MFCLKFKKHKNLDNEISAVKKTKNLIKKNIKQKPK